VVRAEPVSRPFLAGGRVAHHPGDHDAVHLGGQGHRVLRQAVQVVHGAVDRVEDPAHRAAVLAGGRVAVLLAEHRVARPLGAQRVDHLPFHRLVGGRHDVGVGRLGLHVGDRPGAHPAGRGGPVPGDPHRDREQFVGCRCLR
jgi:hypothetical protein